MGPYRFRSIPAGARIYTGSVRHLGTMATTAPVPELVDRARACARRLADAEEVLLASHIDADGLTSAVAATAALVRPSASV